MRIPRPIDATLHGATDYTVGLTLLTAAPRLFGVEGTTSAKQIRASGASHIGYSLFTKYPLGAVKALPYKAHLALDAIGAVTLAATPFVTGQWKRGPRQFVPHLALAAFELASLAMTDPSGRGDFHGDVEAVRRANAESPSAKIDADTPAVTGATRLPVPAEETVETVG
jgi:hypothetical protein